MEMNRFKRATEYQWGWFKPAQLGCWLIGKNVPHPSKFTGIFFLTWLYLMGVGGNFCLQKNIKIVKC